MGEMSPCQLENKSAKDDRGRRCGVRRKQTVDNRLDGVIENFLLLGLHAKNLVEREGRALELLALLTW